MEGTTGFPSLGERPKVVSSRSLEQGRTNIPGWRVFWHRQWTQPAPVRGIVIALENRVFISEGEAKRLVRGLLDAEFGTVSLRRPGSAKIVKGIELRSWLHPTA
jgi:hypothetical protein